MFSLCIVAVWFTFTALLSNGDDIEFSIHDLGDVRLYVELINEGFVATWTRHDANQMLRLFAPNINVTVLDQEYIGLDASTNVLIDVQSEMKIADADFISDSIVYLEPESSDSGPNANAGGGVVVEERGHYLFYSDRSRIIDAGVYRTLWTSNPKFKGNIHDDDDKELPLQILRRELHTKATEDNREFLHFDEHDMGMFWINFWNELATMDDIDNEEDLQHLLSFFSEDYIEIHVYGEDDATVTEENRQPTVFGRAGVRQWLLGSDDRKGTVPKFGENVFFHRKTNRIAMDKISPFQNAYETTVGLMNRETQEILFEHEWQVIMGFDPMENTFYRAVFYHDPKIFHADISQIVRRFPYATEGPEKEEL